MKFGCDCGGCAILGLFVDSGYTVFVDLGKFGKILAWGVKLSYLLV